MLRSTLLILVPFYTIGAYINIRRASIDAYCMGIPQLFYQKTKHISSTHMYVLYWIKIS
jgi:hypothetical protein